MSSDDIATLSSLTDEIFKHRQKYLRYNQIKVQKLKKTLSKEKKFIFSVIPRLICMNQENLPGYEKNASAANIVNFSISTECLLASEALFPGIVFERPVKSCPFILSILLMGSIGTIAHSQKSDLDYTLLIDHSLISEKNLKIFKQKLKKIERWTWEKHKLEIHFFINRVDDFRNNAFGESDKESTGSAQAKLLKEEMYRTFILVAGKIPFWWMVPVETDDDSYDLFFSHLKNDQSLLQTSDFIDLGNIEDISQGEFFGGSIWALIKSFRSPFKTILKMGLLEEYMFGDTRFNLLCHEIKNLIFEDKSLEKIDPYIQLFLRVESYFRSNKSLEELQALRKAFYIKIGISLDRLDFEWGTDDPSKAALIELAKNWGLPLDEIMDLNHYYDWDMLKKVSLGNEINKTLMNSYKKISEKIKNEDLAQDVITKRDTNLLGRKLFSFYRSAPNKVENLFALVDGDTREKELTFYLDSEKDKTDWYLIRGKTKGFLEQIHQEKIIKKTSTLAHLVAFCCFNDLYTKKTKVHYRASGLSFKHHDLTHFLDDLHGFLSKVSIEELPNDDLLADPFIRQLFIIFDFGSMLPRDFYDEENSTETLPNASPSNTGKRLNQIQSVSMMHLTSWGEFYCKTYFGFESHVHALNETTANENFDAAMIDKPGFMKIFVPGADAKQNIPNWLYSYIMNSLK